MCFQLGNEFILLAVGCFQSNLCVCVKSIHPLAKLEVISFLK